MLKTRLIPVLLLKNGMLVRAEYFNYFQVLGNPIVEVERYNEWNVDEIIYLDITRDGNYDQKRSDTVNIDMDNPYAILESVSKTCFMPLTWGGGIKSVKQMKNIFKRGADKITINSAAVDNPELITEAATNFGSQAIVLSIDVFKHSDGTYEVFSDCGKKPSGKIPEDWIAEVQDRGAGEILLNSINRDGSGEGYDLKLIEIAKLNSHIPIIACGGAGEYSHYVEAVNAGADAVAAANIFHFKELSDLASKQVMAKSDINVRL